MKKQIFILLTLLSISSLFAQRYKQYRIGDTIFLKNKVPVPKTQADFYTVVKEKVSINNKRLYKMEGYKSPKDSTSFFKHSIYYTIDPNLVGSESKHIIFHMNGNKLAEGYREKGRNYGLWTYWYDNGQKKEEKRFFKHKALAKKIKDPEILSFWDKNGNQTIENGNGTYLTIKDSTTTKGFYKNGLKHGKFLKTKNEKKVYEEYYKNGKLKQGKSWDKNGKEFSYKQGFKTPQYPGGQKAIAKHIIKNINIPDYAYQNDISGRVILMFKINKVGNISNIRVVKSLCKPCDQEAVRVIRLMKKWKPGESRGQKIKVNYTLPITYNVQ
ncbi:TonB family protein [Tenacibaculum sp. MEBiC06402]|uniref:TonB family protein n=1 Tax=unclassified Tenacibaculum TaxID=2635139 RepID=UPI003B9C90E9